MFWSVWIPRICWIQTFCTDRVGGQEMLDVVGTLLKGSERFLEIRSLLVTSLRNSVFQSLNVVQFFYRRKKTHKNMRSSSSSAWDFFISLFSISLIFLFSKCKASTWKFLFVPTFLFTWRSSETPSLNSSLSLPSVEHLLKHYHLQDLGVLPRTNSSAAGTFDSVSRGIITVFTNDIVLKYCHFDSCLVPAAWLLFLSCSFFQLSPIHISQRFPRILRLSTWKKRFLGTDC